ncbi:MAG: EF-hand domain-containing protein [Deltaproteobacteria bacterium]|nr:EF-hand domain-containing protein [Deltaproteobacteria bacterium]
MRTWFLICAVVITMFISTAFCFAAEKKGHICFRTVDADKDGKVTYQEFKNTFGDDKAKFKAIDANDDGTLSHEEYHKSLGHGASD